MATIKDFELLEECSAETDLTEYQTHKGVAEILYHQITGSRGNLTLGLEGGWGSGKSTVVSILMKELRNHADIMQFYFDAWAHEGDPLRRIFLESMIKQVGETKQGIFGKCFGEEAESLKYLNQQ